MMPACGIANIEVSQKYVGPSNEILSSGIPETDEDIRGLSENTFPQ